MKYGWVWKAFRRWFTGVHRVDVWVTPGVEGWAWITVCNTCQHKWSGAALHREEAEAAGMSLAGPRDEVVVRHRRPGRNSRLADTTALRLDVTPYRTPHRGDPWMVATDGGFNPHTCVAGWGFVTGAGWCRSGSFSAPRKGGVNQAELEAILQAVSTYPHGSTVAVYADNQQVGDYIRRTLAGTKRRHGWEPPFEMRQRLYDLVENGYTVRVLWVRRNSLWLHDYADRLAYAAARPLGGAA